ncbi:helix-turn-helix domain-containing protein [Novilysobacter spongiicola]
MVAGMTVRETAEASGVTVATAFRWRHRSWKP